MAAGGHYFAADADAQDELVRLRLLEDECDPHTRRHHPTFTYRTQLTQYVWGRRPPAD